MSDGGREVGDVELALFRKAPDGGGESFLSKNEDPLSSSRSAYDPPDAPAPAARPPYPTSAAGKSLSSSLSPPASPAYSSLSSLPHPPSTSPSRARVTRIPPLDAPASALVPESSWRNVMAGACSEILGKRMAALNDEFEEAGGPGSGPHAPRDLADYVIMMTLRSQDSFAMQNAPSWLFNTMDRSGAGYVLREEFVRYAPFMSPIADAAVAAAVFDELVRSQVGAQAKLDEEAAKAEKRAPRHQHRGSSRLVRTKERGSFLASGAVSTARAYTEGLRNRRRQAAQTAGTEELDSCGSVVGGGVEEDAGGSVGLLTEASEEMYPISGALRFVTWKQYFSAIQQKSSYKDDDWARVKSELGIDPSERLIKAQGGVDHSQPLPTLGKLFLSQRYLIFFAAVGRNHYVARLGAVAEVGVRSLPLLMRDCFTVHLESETISAMNGISRAHQEPNEGQTKLRESSNSEHSAKVSGGGVEGSSEASASSADASPSVTESQVVPANEDEVDYEEGEVDGAARLKSGNRIATSASQSSGSNSQEKRKEKGWGQEKPMPQHVAGEVMAQFTAGGKPLVFSLIEFRDTSRRDLWVYVIRELVAAHRLHIQLGFGSSGRVVPETSHDIDDGDESTDVPNPGTSSYLTYLASPFCNEPQPPLLVVAAHSNVVRYRSIRIVDGARNPVSLLVFSRAEKCKTAVSWYVDSVREKDNRGGRSWIERATDAIRENMELNKRVYMVQDDEPFDVGRLGDGIGRLAELCTPLVRLSQFVEHIVQWRNPPATVIALLVCLYFVYARWVVYVPSLALFMLACLIVLTRSESFSGLDTWLWGGGLPENAKERQANILELVAHVHDGLRGTQNVIMRLNSSLGKVQTLFLWGSGNEKQTWTIVVALCFIGSFLVLFDTRVIYTAMIWVVFSKHFMPPRNPVKRFWDTVPSKVVRTDPGSGAALPKGSRLAYGKGRRRTGRTTSKGS